MTRFALIDTYSIDGREPGPGDAYELRGAWCSGCQSTREWDEYTEDLTPCTHEQLAAEAVELESICKADPLTLTPFERSMRAEMLAESALGLEMRRAARQMRVVAEALTLTKGGDR